MNVIRNSAEFLFFGGAVTAAHLALFAPQLETGLESAGAGGVDLLQVMASNASIAALVEAWDRPPPVFEDVQAPELSQAPAPVVPEFVKPVMQPPERSEPVATISLAEVTPDGPPLPVLEAAEPPKMTTLAPLAVPTPPAAVPAPPEAPVKPPVSDAPPKTAVPQPPDAMQPPEPPKPMVSPQPPGPPKPEPVPELEPQSKPEPVKTAKTPPQKAPAETKLQKQNSVQVTARKAEGTGGDTARGNNGAENTATLSKAKRTSLARKWGQQIRSRVAHKAPKGAGKGRAVVSLTVSANGAVSNVKVVESSGKATFDKLALKAVRSAGRMPKAPKGLNIPYIEMEIPISVK